MFGFGGSGSSTEPVDSKHEDGAPVFRIRNINLPTLPFDTFLHTLGEITPVATFDPKVLRRGLFHARLFAKLTAEDRSLTVIEVRGGAVFGAGADPTGICMFEAPCLADITVRVPLKAVGIVRRVLAHLDPGSARLLDCDTHHIIRDRQTWLAWPKTSVAFPLIETRIPEHHFDDRVTVSRSELRTSLLQLDIVRLAQVWAPTLVPDQDDDQDFLLAEHDGKTLQLRVSSGEGSTAELSMHLRDSIGKSKGRCDGISCERTVANRDSGKSPKAMDVMVDLLSFLKVVKHFGSPQVCFSVGRNSAGATTYFLIEDHDEEGAWRARTFLDIVPHLGRPPWSPVNPGRRRSGRRA